MTSIKPKVYREIIDDLVEMCHNGQGNIGPRRVMDGIWHKSARKDFLEDQFEINKLLAKLSLDDRIILAKMLSHATETGVFETLKTLEKFDIKPFDSGYEGSPFNDFIGRMDKTEQWDWPENE